MCVRACVRAQKGAQACALAQMRTSSRECVHACMHARALPQMHRAKQERAHHWIYIKLSHE
eukprot:108160-Pleurochrysis_carterae.AAC.8